MSARKPPEDRIAGIAPFGLRMPPDLKERVEAAAKLNSRSMNAEIIARLNFSFERMGIDEIDEKEIEKYMMRNKLMSEMNRYEQIAMQLTEVLTSIRNLEDRMKAAGIEPDPLTDDISPHLRNPRKYSKNNPQDPT